MSFYHLHDAHNTYFGEAIDVANRDLTIVHFSRILTLPKVVNSYGGASHVQNLYLNVPQSAFHVIEFMKHNNESLIVA